MAGVFKRVIAELGENKRNVDVAQERKRIRALESLEKDHGSTGAIRLLLDKYLEGK